MATKRIKGASLGKSPLSKNTSKLANNRRNLINTTLKPLKKSPNAFSILKMSARKNSKFKRSKDVPFSRRFLQHRHSQMSKKRARELKISQELKRLKEINKLKKFSSSLKIPAKNTVNNKLGQPSKTGSVRRSNRNFNGPVRRTNTSFELLN